MTAFGYLITLVALFFVWRRLQQDYIGGLAVGVALAVFLPASMRISLGLFEFTVQRMIILLIAVAWLRFPRSSPARKSAPLLALLLWVAAARFVSMLTSVSFADSLKDFFSYAIEVCLFYTILASSIRSSDSALRVLGYLCLSIASGGAAAVIERYTSLNFQDLIAPGELIERHGSSALYPHRIMLGYAMAMGTPILVALIFKCRSKLEGRLAWLALIITVVACYFSISRGPWLGIVLGVIVLTALGSARPRKVLFATAGLALVVMIARPGVKDTIVDLLTTTFQEDSVKGKSYEYRWRLWEVAWGEISRSTLRTLFGYGGLSRTGMDMSGYFEKQHGGNAVILGYTSWDNNYASDLLEYGVIGVIAETILYAAILYSALVNWRDSTSQYRDVAGAIVGASVVYLFAMSNVNIFSPQLKCQFWVIVAAGTGFLFQRRISLAETEDVSPVLEELAPTS